MIRKLKFLDTRFSGLDAYFPIGSELNVDSNVVLIIGPNGSGKTCLVRMLATSLEYNRFFSKEGISKSWKDPISHHGCIEEFAKAAVEAKEVQPGWYEGDAYILGYAIKELERDPRFSLHWKKDVKERERGKNWVSASAIEQFKNAEKLMKERTEVNRWRYIKPTADENPLYYQQFELPADEESVMKRQQGYNTYLEFNPSFDGNRMVKIFPFEREIYETIAKRMGKSCEYDPDAVRRLKNSPGQTLKSDLEKALAHVEDFFEKKVNPRFHPKTDSVAELMSLGEHPRWRPEPVSSDAQLIVFMDEPTLFLDYKAQLWFRDQILTLTQRHGDKLQFFIPTNDATLIERMSDCCYINLYEQPAKAGSSFSLNLG